MAKIVTLAEMITLARRLDPEGTGNLRRKADASVYAIEAMAVGLANDIAAALGVRCGPATFAPEEFGGIAAPFYPAHDGQACPPPLDEYDPTEWERETP